MCASNLLVVAGGLGLGELLLRPPATLSEPQCVRLQNRIMQEWESFKKRDRCKDRQMRCGVKGRVIAFVRAKVVNVSSKGS